MLKSVVFILILYLNNFLFAQDLELKKIFDDKKVEGTIVIESLNKKRIFIYNDERADSFFSPASTFKIPNTLIALNEKIASKNQDLELAFKNSCVPCYQEFASKIGLEKYKKYLEELDYGNKNLSNDVRNFWLDESLKISVYGEIKFLKRLYLNDLPFKQDDINTVKEIMIDEENENYTIRAKTGWEGKYGWYVGYVETKDDVWFFALNIDTKTKEDLAKRKIITLEALKVEGIIN